MFKNRAVVVVVAAFVALASGCKKSPPSEAGGPQQKPGDSAAKATPSPDSVVRIHWRGKKWLATQTNGAAFFEICNTSESARLQAQTLEKLTRAFRASQSTNAVGTTNESAVASVLEAIVQSECFVDVRSTSNNPVEFAFAVRTEPAQKNIRQDLPKVFQAFVGNAASSHVNVQQAGEWTVVASEAANGGLCMETVKNLQANGAKLDVTASNAWLELDLDLPWLSGQMGWREVLPENLPRVSCNLSFEGDDVRTRAMLKFKQPVASSLPGWNVPTNLIEDPLVSFTAVRGVKDGIASTKWWRALNAGEPPGQFFFWGQAGMPLQTYFAAHSSNASNIENAVSQVLTTRVNPWMEKNAYGTFETTSNGAEIFWSNMPVAEVHLERSEIGSNQYLVGGLLHLYLTNQPTPTALLDQLAARTNLVYYDWEMTGPRLDQWLFSSQLLRLALHRAQLPTTGLGAAWIRALTPLLGNSGTIALQTAPDQISFSRKSNSGFSAIELHLIADWLESPAFPRGLQTLLGDPGMLVRPKSHAQSQPATNSLHTER
jgi:hypothetical protein